MRIIHVTCNVKDSLIKNQIETQSNISLKVKFIQKFVFFWGEGYSLLCIRKLIYLIHIPNIRPENVSLDLPVIIFNPHKNKVPQKVRLEVFNFGTLGIY